MNSIMSKYILVMLSSIVSGCCTQHKQYNANYDINGITNFVELKDTMSVIILGYAPAQKCNDTLKSCSTCFCMDVRTDMIYKVYSYCNCDTVIKKGDLIRIAPIEQRILDKESIVISSVFMKRNRELEYSPLYKLQVYTTWGEILLK